MRTAYSYKSIRALPLFVVVLNLMAYDIVLAQSAPAPCPPAICAVAGSGGSCTPPDADSNCPITVPPGNRAPSISGAPPADVNVDELWSFTPAASDPDGDTLTFSVANAPGWMNIDPATGRLEGRPTVADVGVHENIVITVSDGSLEASLGPFSVEVTQVALGSITLNWSLPTLYVDGSALSEIASVNIYYGTSRGNYPNKIEITEPSTVSYLVEDLVPGTYFFALTITDNGGTESDWSNEVEVTVE